MHQSSNFDDVEVLRLARGGDPGALAGFVRRHESALYRFLLLTAASEAQAEQLLHATFFEVLDGRASPPGARTFRQWLAAIAVQLMLSGQRSPINQRIVERIVRMDASWVDVDPAAGGSNMAWTDVPRSPYASRQNRATLNAALVRLQPALRAVFVLRDMEGFLVGDIADMLHLPLHEVRQRLQLARLSLRDTLSPSFNGTAARASHA